MIEDTLAVVTNLLNDNSTDVVELSNAQFITYMVIGIPSWFLYILIVVLFLRASNRPLFGNSYYRLVSVIGISVKSFYFISNYCILAGYSIVCNI